MLLTIFGFIFFLFPGILFIFLTVMMMKDLKREDQTVSTLINVGIGVMIAGAVMLAIRYLFMPLTI